MRWWKVVGLAGLAGVAATGAVIARSERRRRAYTPDEIRQRLHARVTEETEHTEQVEHTGQPDADRTEPPR